jgi:LacI family transcriptional regulator
MNDMWVGGFMSEQAKWPDSVVRVPPLLSPRHERTEFLRWFKTQKPDVILASQGEPVREWLAGERIAVPDDVSLVDLRCYDRAAGNTGVHYDISQTGALAVEMLIGHLYRGERGVPTRPHEVLLQGDWIEGASLRPPGRVGRA